jgi:hypothetical protein
MGEVELNEGAQGTPLSMITKTQYRPLRSTNNQRAQQIQMANIHANRVKWLSGLPP